MQKDIFISYKAEEFNEANWVKTKLEEQGISCWMAPEDIRGGSSYASEIPVAIRECKIYVLILSSKAQESKWVPRELDQAINDNKIIMPFMIENCALKDDFKFYLTNVQRYMAYEEKEKAILKLSTDIKLHLGIEEYIEEKESVQTNPVEVEFREKTKETQNDNKLNVEKSKGKKKRAGFIFILAAMILVAMILGGLIFGGAFVKNQSPKLETKEPLRGVEIAGEYYDKGTTSLYLENIDISSSEVESIKKLEQLSFLSLKNCNIQSENIGSMIGNEMLSLTIENCNLTKAQIASLDLTKKEIIDLDLSGNMELDSMDVIEPLYSTLFTLDISNTSISDISSLASFSELEELRADNNGITDISALSNCSKLTQVSLNSNKLTDLRALESCIFLTQIWAENNEITSLDGLNNATVLEIVCLSNNNIEQIDFLAKSSNTLKQVYLRNNSIRDISALSSCTELTYIALDGNQITTLEPLANSKKLVGVTAAENQIKNTKGIEGLGELVYVNLANNGLTEVGVEQVLSFGNEYGAVLDLSDNSLEMVRVSGGERFALVSLAGSTVQDASFLYNIQTSELFFEYPISIDFEKLKAAEHYSYTIFSCPLDKQVEVMSLLDDSATIYADSIKEIYKVEDYYSDEMIGSRESIWDY